MVITGLVTALALQAGAGYESPFAYRDPAPKSYRLTKRASEIDPRVRAHPEIKFPLVDGKGRPQDTQWAVVDTRVRPRGRLVIWMMGGGGDLPAYTSAYGMHAIGVYYARGWFSTIKQGKAPRDRWRGDVRLEATTGEDASPLVDIPKPDGMAERAYRFVKWLSEAHPQGRWDFFLTPGGRGLDWEKVIVTGVSHGATSAARFAMHVKVARAVLFTGPRDQDQDWQSGKSATPANRFFGFSHVKDGGWTGHHYCRSWEYMGLLKFGPITDVDALRPPYGHTRCLVTSVPAKSSGQAHSGVYPCGSSFKKGGKLIHEDVWRYLFTHPVDEVGKPAAPQPRCAGKHRRVGR